jgi:hypothetical protein
MGDGLGRRHHVVPAGLFLAGLWMAGGAAAQQVEFATSSTYHTTASTITLRGRYDASDVPPGWSLNATWIRSGSQGEVSGRLIGLPHRQSVLDGPITSRLGEIQPELAGELNWVAPNIPLQIGSNAFSWSAERTSPDGLETAGRGGTGPRVVRHDPAELLLQLSLGGVLVTADADLDGLFEWTPTSNPVLRSGASTLGFSVLTQPGLLDVLQVKRVHLLVDGVVVTTSTSATGSFALPLTNLPAGEHRLGVAVEIDDGTALVSTRAELVVAGGGRLTDFPFTVDSTVTAATRTAPAFRTIASQDQAANRIDGFAADPSDRIWALAPIPPTSWAGPTETAVGSEIRYLSQLVLPAGATSYLRHWNGSSWKTVTPANLLGGPSPTGLIFTAVASDGANLWLGTNRGLLRAAPTLNAAGQIDVRETVTASSLAGSWIASLRLEPNGTLWVGSQGSRYYTYQVHAQKRYWEDAGGVSWRSAAGVWQSRQALRNDDGSWAAMGGYEIRGLRPVGANQVWVSTENGLSYFDGAGWSHETPDETGLPSGAGGPILAAATATAAEPLVRKGAVWSYLDDGTDLDAACPGAQAPCWREPGFKVEANWSEGPGELGYGDAADGRPEATITDFGPDVEAKLVTTYFRHTFDVCSAAQVASLTLDLLRDDGAVVYLNGMEVVRSNMPAGVIGNTTPALTSSIDEVGDQSFAIDPSYLVDGLNTLAVEIHQAAVTSSDISFDLGLTANVTPLRPDEVWVDAPTGVARRLRNQDGQLAWTVLGCGTDSNADNALCEDDDDTLAARGMLGAEIGNRGKVWMAIVGEPSTRPGFEDRPSLLEIDRCTGKTNTAGYGIPHGLTKDTQGRIWRAAEPDHLSTNVEFSRLVDGDVPPLSAPSLSKRLATAANGAAAVDLVWEAVAGAQSYEVFLAGRPIATGVTATTWRLNLLPGVYWWSVQAVFAGGIGSGQAESRYFVVEDRRDRADLETMIQFRNGNGQVGLLDLRRQLIDGTSHSFVISPETNSATLTCQGQDDLAVNSEGSMLLALRDHPVGCADPVVGGAIARYPYPIATSLLDYPNTNADRFWVDATSEPGGFVIVDTGDPLEPNGSQRLVRFRVLSEATGVEPTSEQSAFVLPDAYLEPLDVAGLAAGRFAILARTDAAHGALHRVVIEDLRGANARPALVTEITVPNRGGYQRLTGLPDGGFALLDAPLANAYPRVFIYDSRYHRVGALDFDFRSGAGNAGPKALDIATDAEGRLLVLVWPGTGASAKIYYRHSLDPLVAWSVQTVTVPAGATTSDLLAGLGAFASPPTLRATSFEAGAGPPPARPGGGTTIELGSGIFLHRAAGGGCTGGAAFIQGFLEAGSIATCTPGGSISGSNLYLNYTTAEYGAVPSGAPSAGGKVQLVSGCFSLALGGAEAGRITSCGGTMKPSISPLGLLAVSSYRLLGIGTLADVAEPRGILATGTSDGNFGLGKKLTFDALFLTDIGGTFVQTFGGVDGIGAPYASGNLGWDGVPIRFRPTGPLAAQAGCGGLGLGAVNVELLKDGKVLLPFSLSGVCMTAATTSFANTTIDFLSILGVKAPPVAQFELTIPAATVSATGIAVPTGATLALGPKQYQLTALHFGADGFGWDSAPNFDLIALFTASMKDVDVQLPSDASPGSLHLGSAELSIRPKNPAREAAMTGSITDLDLPFAFFAAPPAAYPRAAGGSLRHCGADEYCSNTAQHPNAEADNPFSLAIGPGLSIDPDRVRIPAISIDVKKPKAFALEFPGAEITKTAFTLFDPPPVTPPGTSVSLDFGDVTIGRDGFLAASMAVHGGGIDASLTDFKITASGQFSASGGSFSKAGFAFSITNFKSWTGIPSSQYDYQFGAMLTWSPWIVNATGDVFVGGSPPKLGLQNFSVDQIKLGPVTIKKPRLDIKSNPDMLTFGGALNLPKLPEIMAELQLTDGKFHFLKLQATWDPPGQPLPGPLSAVFLQSVGGSYDHLLREAMANVVMTAGPSLTVPGVLIGQSGSPKLSLLTLAGAFTAGEHGFKATAGLRLFKGAGFNGFALARGVIAGGDLGYLGISGVSGTGLYMRGDVNLFFGILDVNGNLLILPNDYSGSLRGTLQIPDDVPVVGGVELGGVAVAASGRMSPASFKFEGSAWVDLGCVDWPSCTSRSCQACTDTFLGRVCVPSVCVSCRAVQHCTKLDVGFKISNTKGFQTLAGADGPTTPEFAASGMQSLTNFRPLGSAPGPTTFAAGAAASTLTIPVTRDYPTMVVSADWSAFTGDVQLEILFPTGQRFTASNTPPFERQDTIGPMPKAGEIPISYRHVVESSPTPRHETAFLFRGPFAHVPVPVVTRGEATGETIDDFGPTAVPHGNYTVTVRASGAAASAAILDCSAPASAVGIRVCGLGGNSRAELLRSTVSNPTASHRVDVTYTLRDADGDHVNVQLLVASDPRHPEQGVPLLGDFGRTLTPAPGASASEQQAVQLDALALRNVDPAHLYLSWADGDGAGSTFVARNERQYQRLATFAGVGDPFAPPRVDGVVVHPRPADGVLEVYWNPVCWTPPTAGSGLTAFPTVQRISAYGVSVQELGPVGSTAPAWVATIEVPDPQAPTRVTANHGCSAPYATEVFLADSCGEDTDVPPDGEACGDADDQRLIPGREYRITVTAVSTETAANKGPTIPACTPSATEDCKSDLVFEHAGLPSLPVELELPGDGNLAPRFLATPQSIVELQDTYLTRLRATDADGDNLTLELVPAEPTPLPELAVGQVAPVRLAAPDAVTPAVTAVGSGEWVLSFTPQPANLGRQPLAVRVSDGRGGEARLEWVVDIVPFGAQQIPLEDGPDASITSRPSRSVRVGETFSYQVEVTGLTDDAPLAYEVTAGPSAMTVGDISGLVTWVPGAGDVGDHVVLLEVREGVPASACTTCEGGIVAEQSFLLTVEANPFTDLAPYLAANPTTLAIPAAGGTAAVDVVNAGKAAASISWSTAPQVAWLTIASGGTGQGSGRITIRAAANAGAARTGVVRVTATAAGATVANSPIDVEVSQAAGNGDGPKVRSVSAVASTESATIPNNGRTSAGITQLRVGFDRGVLDSAGNSGPLDVTNPDNYLLVDAGNNGTLDTSACAGAAGDDRVHVPVAVQYAAAATTATLRLDPTTSLPAGRYRLRVCANVVDLSGHRLDGNSDGKAGDDFQLDFAVLATNRLANPNFDADVTSWTPASPHLTDIQLDPQDAGAVGTSGSVRLGNSGGAGAQLSVAQCVGLGGATAYDVGGLGRIEGAVGAAPVLSMRVSYFSSAACTGSALATESLAGLSGGTAGAWKPFVAATTPPAGAGSAQIRFLLAAGAATGFVARLDSLFFREHAACPEGTLCFANGRFQATLSFGTVQGGGLAGDAKTVPLEPLGIPLGGVFYFSSPQNPEVLVKVLNGCAINSRFWVFYAATTNVGFDLAVTDTFTGDRRLYHNPDVHAASPVNDTQAFATCDAVAPLTAEEGGMGTLPPAILDTTVDSPPVTARLPRREISQQSVASVCAPGATTLCIDDQPGDRRWRLGLHYHTTRSGGLQGDGPVTALAPAGISQGGIISFLDPTNPELLVKVLNGCGINHHYWLFYAATTDLGFELAVEDTTTGTVVTYTNPDRATAATVTDTSAFATCP